jgi:ribonuclease R
MVGEKTGKVFKLGESVKIIVAGVDKLTQTIDFVLDTPDAKEKIAGEAAPKKEKEKEEKKTERQERRRKKKKAVKRKAKRGKEHGKGE